MTDDIRLFTNEMLHELKHQCTETLKAVHDRLSNDISVQEGLGRLLKNQDMLAEFRFLESESKDLAAIILQGAVAALINSKSIETIDAELNRRIVELN
jgi:hypothetical protein